MFRLRALPLIVAGAIAAACGSSATTSTTATAPSTTRCQATLSASSSNFGADGGSGSVAVTVARECSWTASSQASWIQVTGTTAGQGDGTVTFRVAANGDPVERRGGLGVADQIASVTQAGAPCRFDITPPQDVPPAGGQSAIAVQTQDACSWNASSTAAWVSLSPSSGKGSASIVAAAQPNDGPERLATVSIGLGQATLRQAAAAAPSPGPSPTPQPTPTPTPTPQPPTPTPNPPPEPTPPPSDPGPKKGDVKGRISNLFGLCPEVWFSVEDQLVHTTGATDYKRGDSCRDLQNGRQVTVKGSMQTLLGRTYLQADVIEIK